MNNQEIFDKSVEHILSMPSRASDGQTCVYNKSFNGGCAVGCLLTGKSEEVANMTTNASVKCLLDTFINKGIKCPVVKLESLDLLTDLQGAHDVSYNWNEDGFTATYKLGEIARKHKLKSIF